MARGRKNDSRKLPNVVQARQPDEIWQINDKDLRHRFPVVIYERYTDTVWEQKTFSQQQ